VARPAKLTRTMSDTKLAALLPRSQWLHFSEGPTVLVFVHGFLSSRKESWTYSGGSAGTEVYWPSLVRSDPQASNASLYAAGYYTALESGTYGIAECADAIWADLSEPDVHGRPPVLSKAEIVFVCHSFGGVVVRRILVDRQRELVDKRIGLALYASPSRGARVPKLVKPIARFLRNRVVVELVTQGALVNDLDDRFRSLLASPTFELHGFERAEHRSMLRFFVPGLGLLVPTGSACAYFGAPRTIPSTDHSSIVKPSGNEHEAHKVLMDFLRSKFPSARAVEAPPRAFKSLAACVELCSVAQARFGCRWEKSGYDSAAPTRVYWPVRLRRYTAIHASQAFMAAGLQRLGATVHLYIDNLGNVEYDTDLFKTQLFAWVARAGGDPTRVEVGTFSDIIGGAQSEAWQITQRWLGDAEHRLDRVLRVSKLVDSSPVDSEKLLAQRPRRLLTPSVVWAVLEHLSARDPKGSFITLSGIDEIQLWGAWRELTGGLGRRVGHLYLPELITGGEDERRALHMQRDPMHWTSADDIAHAIQGNVDLASRAHYLDPGRLVDWSLQACIFLLAYLNGQPLELAVDGVTVTTASQMRSLDYGKVRDALCARLEEALFC